ncbi:MAG: AAA family ATPase [Treponema sp.]|nr:AAA family ATPase [Treponema sp.]
MTKLIKFIPTDIEQIDALIKGFYPSELIVIGAKPGSGKTTFLCELAKNICVDDIWIY